jgi:hypothetical protein
LCSSVLPPNLVKRELENTTTLSLDFLRSCTQGSHFLALPFAVENIALRELPH